MGRRKINSDNLKEEKRSNGSIMTTTEYKSDEEFESVSKVFNNPLLMEKILRYAVHKPNGKETDKKAGLAIRLVNKNWLQSASCTLTKLDDPMIHITVDLEKGKHFPDDKIPNNEKGDLLEQFILVFSKYSKRSADSILPLSLSLEPLYFIKENGEILRKFFQQCGDMIFKLNVSYPRCDGGSLSFEWNDINFSNLQTLKFIFNLSNSSYLYNFTAIGKKPKGFMFLQQILQNSQNLKHFKLDNFNEYAVDISCLILPTTIKSLGINRTLTCKYLTVLKNNKLSGLDALELEIGEQEEADVMFKILEHFSEQLRNFNLQVKKTWTDPDIYVRFPLLEKLNCLTISGDGFCLSPKLKNGWPKFVPNLTCLVIDNLAQSHFIDLVHGSKFEKVRKLKFSYENRFSPEEQAFREIIVSFPVIQKLSLYFRIGEMSSLKFLFQNFTHLKNLRLFVYADWFDGPLDYKMVSLFLGSTIDVVQTLISGAQKDLKVQVENPESIMNLKEMNSFTLKLVRYHRLKLESIDDPFCLKFLQTHGLEKMPNLQKIKLSDEKENFVH